MKRFIQFRDGFIFSDWIRDQITIDKSRKLIKTSKIGLDLDLHDFIVRRSKIPDKKCVVLEPIRNFDKNKAVRITSSTENEFESF